MSNELQKVYYIRLSIKGRSVTPLDELFWDGSNVTEDFDSAKRYKTLRGALKIANGVRFVFGYLYDVDVQSIEEYEDQTVIVW